MTDLSNCRFCSEISKQSGEDPIGTAGNYDHWLILEIKPPWSSTMWVEDSRLTPVVEVIKKLIVWHNWKIRILAIAPDSEYSLKGYARLFYYRRPAQNFSKFDKQEFLVPECQLMPLAISLLKNNVNMLSTFEQYRQSSDHIREILICTHANVDVACGRFGYPIYKKLRSDYSIQEKLRTWRCSHFGGHQFAPTLIDFPQGRWWGHLEINALNGLIHQQGDTANLLKFYRGWSGLKPLEQIVEREIWRQEGWKWLNYPKSGKIVDLEGVGMIKYFYLALQNIPFQPLQILLERWTKKNISLAKIQIEFTRGDYQNKEAYTAIIEKSAPVLTALHSAQEMQLISVNQYRLIHISKLD